VFVARNFDASSKARNTTSHLKPSSVIHLKKMKGFPFLRKKAARKSRQERKSAASAKKKSEPAEAPTNMASQSPEILALMTARIAQRATQSHKCQRFSKRGTSKP
jgi:hypothetical protein